MKFFRVLFLFVFFSSLSVFSQEKFTRHTVTNGETISEIARKYNVEPNAIYELNPDARGGVKAQSILLIPLLSNAEKAITARSSSEVTHEILPKETLYGLSIQYKVKIADLYSVNPNLEQEGLKIGQNIVIPQEMVSNTIEEIEEIKIKTPNVVLATTVLESKSNTYKYTRKVLPKETKYGIAKEYGITIAELEKQNPSILNNLTLGTELTILSSKEKIFQTVKQEELVIEESKDIDNIVGENPSSNNSLVHDADFVGRLIQKVSENIGAPYLYGGTTKNGFDCSGLMCATYGVYNIKLPRSTSEMASYGAIVNSKDAQKGDLIFFKTNGRSRVNHVGMVIEVANGEIKFIHSSTHGGVIISSTKESYYENCFAHVNRVL